MDDNEDVVQQLYNNQLMRWRWNYCKNERPQLARPHSQKRRGISQWGIDECCEAPSVEHGITRRFVNGINLAERRQY